MSNVKPSRSELLNLKKTEKIAVSGHKLLKRKRDGLIQEFFKVLDKAKETKFELQNVYEQAKGSINLARAVDGSAKVKSASLAIKEATDINVETRNVMGIIVPKISSHVEIKAFDQRGYGVIGTSGYIDDAAESYEKVLKNIIIAAEIETTLKKLVMEIDKTKRRVNALEFRVIPKIGGNIKYIKQRLEGMEREDIFRLKKIKSKRSKVDS
ncbi:MAG TPA: V-type ATP synthase subunit D [archaeon]|nr:V-type ATP synthase subunit D [archaeon]